MGDVDVKDKKRIISIEIYSCQVTIGYNRFQTTRFSRDHLENTWYFCVTKQDFSVYLTA